MKSLELEMMEERQAKTENLLRDLVSGIADVVPHLLSRPAHQSPQTHSILALCLDGIMKNITDPDPDKSLELSARAPCAVVKNGFAQGPITPLKRWREIESALEFMPGEIRQAAPLVGLGSGKLPAWSQIENLFAAAGFKAVPVIRAVGNSLFQLMISRNEFPVCTEWMMRYRRGPFLTIGDTFHEIGHGLAFANSEYKSFSLLFAKNFIRTEMSSFQKTSFSRYLRCFEYGVVIGGSEGIRPLGPVPLILDSLKMHRKRLTHRLFDEKGLYKGPEVHRPFSSFEQWKNAATELVGLSKAQIPRPDVKGEHSEIQWD